MIPHYMMENEPGKEQGKSKYSSGINIIIRLDELWKKTHLFALEGQYKLLNIVLDRVWLELSRDLAEKPKKGEKNFKEYEKDFDEFEEKLKDIGGIVDDKKAGFAEAQPEDIEKRNKHYKVLRKKQQFLARLENKLGKGTTVEEDDDDDID